MTNKQVGFTPPGGAYPPYVNVSEVQSGVIQITVRSPKGDAPDGPMGVTAYIQMSVEDFRAFLADIESADF